MPLDLARIKALCFDVDGTLNDTDDQFAETVKTLLKPLGLFPFVDRDRMARWFVTWAEAPSNALLGYADRIGIDDQMSALMEWLSRHHRRKQKIFQISGPAFKKPGDMNPARPRQERNADGHHQRKGKERKKHIAITDGIGFILPQPGQVASTTAMIMMTRCTMR
jgi:hypothetical protein